MTNVYKCFALRNDYTLKKSLFGDAKLVKNADIDKYKYSRYGIGFDTCGSFLLPNGCGFGKNGIIFCTGMCSSVHINMIKKN